MSERFASRAAVRDKVEWEGGIMEALEYGVRSTDMPLGDEELNEAWGKLAAAFEAMRPLAAVVEKMLDADDEDEPDSYEGVATQGLHAPRADVDL